MRSYLDFEKPVAELEAKVEELRALQESGDAVAEEAALALGGSHLAPAVELLLEAWKTARGAEFRDAILRGLSISRDDRAVAFLQALAADGRPQDATAARAALELFQTNPEHV